MIRSRNVIPAIKDHLINQNIPLGTGATYILFVNPWYDYDLVGVSALVTTVTQAAAVAFTLGFGSYTDENGVIQSGVAYQFLPAANALDYNGQTYSTQILPVGAFNFFSLQTDPTGLGTNILRAGMPLTLTVPSVSNTGKVQLTIALRPKDKDRNDFSKCPGGSAYDAYPNYYK